MLITPNSEARQADRQLIFVNCPSDIEEPERLCQAVILAFAAATPSSTVRHVPPGAEAPTGAGDVGVTLMLTNVTERGMTGRLDWQIGQGQRQTGTEIRFSVTDTSLSPRMYENFARSLVKASDGMIKAINSDRLGQ